MTQVTNKASPQALQPNDVPVLLKRMLQAQVIGPIHAEMVAALGKDKADALLDAAIQKAAIAEGRSFAAAAPEGKPSMAHFQKLYELWSRNGALEIDLIAATDSSFDFDVTRCRYAETYKEMGLGHIGHLMSCNRDGTFCQGYDPNIVLERKETIMSGSRRCTFRYRAKEIA
ncbi:MAG: L-2-amino-thiazoline-4-carboxylic acid hydrolase [Alphaproteobacteria bacterium]|nr:L-2-amino-thiazoline-4-carboxylic acid hydrolase [Alphaproteobacteria bacterium]